MQTQELYFTIVCLIRVDKDCLLALVSGLSIVVQNGKISLFSEDQLNEIFQDKSSPAVWSAVSMVK